MEDLKHLKVQIRFKVGKVTLPMPNRGKNKHSLKKLNFKPGHKELPLNSSGNIKP